MSLDDRDTSLMLQNHYNIPTKFEPIFSACIQRRPLIPALNLTLPKNLAFVLPESIDDIDKFDRELVYRAPNAMHGSAFFHSTDKLGEEMSLTTADKGDGTRRTREPNMERYLDWLNELVKDEGNKTQWRFESVPVTCDQCEGIITLASPSEKEVRDLYGASWRYKRIADAFVVARAKEAVWKKHFRDYATFIPWIKNDLEKLVHEYHEFVFEAQTSLERLREIEHSTLQLPTRLEDAHAARCSTEIKETVSRLCRGNRSLLDALYQEGLTFTYSFLATVFLAFGQYTLWRLSRVKTDARLLAEYEFGYGKGLKSIGNESPIEEKEEEVMSTY